MSTTFLGAVNRILRIEGIIRGDTDPLTSFGETAHNATSQIAQIAIQAELSELISRELLPYNRKITGTLTLVSGQRLYSMPSDFKSFWGSTAYFYDSTSNTKIYEYAGGENTLREAIYTYRTDTGSPYCFYWELGTSKKVGFYQVPDANADSTVYAYDYESDTNVTNAADTLPFTSTNEEYAFCEAASRRFKFMYEGKHETDIAHDPMYNQSRTTLFNLLRHKSASTHYGKIYV